MYESRPLYIFFSMVFLYAIGSAQDVSDEDVIVLDPFVVETVEGYQASQSNSGTRLQVEIHSLPMPIEVITSDFIEDTGSTDLNEALQYTAGVFSESFFGGGGSGATESGANAVGTNEASPSAAGGGGNAFNNSLTIRGYTVPYQQRLGFRVGGSVPQNGIVLGGLLDASNISRIEIVRGPASLLYGLGVISGVVNVQPLRPLSEFSSTVNSQVGSNNLVRVSADATGPVIDGVNVRVVGAVDRRDDWTDFLKSYRDYFAAQVDMKPTKWLDVFLEYQRGTFTQDGIGAQYIFDNDENSASEYFRNEWGEFYNWARDFGGMESREIRLSGPDSRYERHEDNVLGLITFSPTDSLSIVTGAYFVRQNSTDFRPYIQTITNEDVAGFTLSPSDPLVSVFPIPDDLRIPTSARTSDLKAVRYWWAENPTELASDQFRIEGSYTVDHSLFSKEMTHTLLAGLQYIHDQISFVSGATPTIRTLDPGSDTDPYIVRSVFDYSPIQYNGETLAQPGSTFREVELDFEGRYVIYQGQWWDRKLQLIAGIRQDLFDSSERVFERPQIVATSVTDGYYGGDNRVTGVLSERSLFEERIDIVSKTVALSFNPSDSLSIYGLIGEGVSPNTGLTNGLNQGLEPEETRSEEIGFKFRFFENRVSGTAAFYRITRDNAVWSYGVAPAPTKWTTGSEFAVSDFSESTTFNPDEPIVYGVHDSFFNPTDLQSRPALDPDTGLPVFDDDGNLVIIQPVGVVGRRTDPSSGDTYIYLDYSLLDEGGFRDEIEAAFNTPDTEETEWISYTKEPDVPSNNPSNGNARGAFTTFSDEAVGVDLQIFVRMTDNWSVILAGSRTERQTISGLQMVNAVDEVTGEPFGTEYDIWVRNYGRENFSDPRDASTAQLGSLEDQSLYFQPEVSASMWTRYDFLEGFLSGFSVGGGVIYQGPAQTSVSIGGDDLQENRFRTPDTAERYRFDLLFAYEKQLSLFDLRIQVNVYNVANDTGDTTVVDYDDTLFGIPQKRRSETVFEPRSVRIAARLSF